MHVAAAVFTAACFLLLTVKVVIPAIICAVIAIASCLVWVWNIDKGPDKGPVDIGGGYKLPVYVTGPMAHGWWAMIVLMIVAGSIFLSYVFSYLYLWTVSPEVWQAGRAFLPSLSWPLATAGLLIASAIVMRLAKSALPEPGERRLVVPVLILVSAALAIAGITAELYGHWSNGLRPTETSYGAMVFMGGIVSAQIIVAISVMSLFCAARHVAGLLDRVRWASLENTTLLLYYVVGQALFGLLLIHGFPHIMGGGS